MAMSTVAPGAGGWREHFAHGLTAVGRGLAGFLGGFTLLNLLGELRTTGFDANEWWIDLRWLPSEIGGVALALAATILAIWAVRPFRGQAMRWLTRGVIVLLMLVVARNLAMFYLLAIGGVVRVGVWVPFSFWIAAALAIVLTATLLPAGKLSWRGRGVLAVTFAACLVGFPLLQMYCFGKTDYRRKAGAIVVLGAKVNADGTMSTALQDRVATACDLYLEGYAPVIVFSGGPGSGPVDEPHAMRTYALGRGIPESAMVLDGKGLNTERTAENSAGIFAERGIKSAVVVSHWWHLPRIKLACERAGLEVYTVPAVEPWPLQGRHFLMGREVAGLWVYYLRPLAGGR